MGNINIFPSLISPLATLDVDRRGPGALRWAWSRPRPVSEIRAPFCDQGEMACAAPSRRRPGPRADLTPATERAARRHNPACGAHQLAASLARRRPPSAFRPPQHLLRPGPLTELTPTSERASHLLGRDQALAAADQLGGAVRQRHQAAARIGSRDRSPEASRRRLYAAGARPHPLAFRHNMHVQPAQPYRAAAQPPSVQRAGTTPHVARTSSQHRSPGAVRPRRFGRRSTCSGPAR